MKRNLSRVILIPAVAAGGTLLAASSQHVLRVREWRTAHERQILDELMRLVSLPNIASNQADIAKNADRGGSGFPVGKASMDDTRTVIVANAIRSLDQRLVQCRRSAAVCRFRRSAKRWRCRRSG